jgi:microcystin degradation protein MlrC
MTEGPVIMLDHFDNTGSGGTMDTTRVLAEIMRQGLDDAVFFAIRDPESVARLIEAGVGNEATVRLGGKMDMPALDLRGEPLEVTGQVRLISDGGFTIRGPMYTGVRVSMGRSVVLDTGKVEVVVTEHHHEPWDLGCLLSLGIDPRAKRYVALKSRIHYRAGFKPIAKAIVECAGVGVCTSDYGRLTFRRMRRPIYPLDLINEPAPPAR